MFFFSVLIFVNFIIFLTFSKLAKKLNIFDVPDKKRKLHNKPIASIGGIFILNALLISVIYIYVHTNPLFPGFKNLISFFFTGLIIFVTGVIDDKFSIKPNIKLGLLFFIILTLILINENLILKELNFSFSNKKIYLENFGVLFTVLCILLFINAFNMLDGINLVAGIYSFLLFLCLYLISNNEFYIFFLASLPFFLVKNFKNNSFLGNSGSLVLGFILAVSFIKLYKTSDIIYSDKIFLFMSIPGLDMFRLFVSRIIKGKNPFEADRNHLHHLLINKFSNLFAILIFLFLFLIPIFVSCYTVNLLIPNILSIFLYGSTIFILIKLNEKNFKH